MHEALFYIGEGDGKVKCQLCPQNCLILPGKAGNCRVRKNLNGQLVALVYGKVASLAVDPIEKKPLYHFFPGKKILSIGNVGCNLHCIFCQNHDISQCDPDDFHWFKTITPSQISVYAQNAEDNIGVAYTYNEPFTFYEYLKDTAIKTKESGMKNVVVSNGYINEEPLRAVLPLLDAFNIDLKGFSDGFYKKITRGSLAPVLNTLKIIARSDAHLEITNLVIPELNDDEHLFTEMVSWISGELGRNVPLHLSRYFPRYKLDHPATPAGTLEKFYRIARKQLDFVYLGNLAGENRSDTLCPGCGSVLVARQGYQVRVHSLGVSGECKLCGFPAGFVMK